MSVVVELPGDALIIRFRPTAPASVLKSAHNELNRTEDHAGLSCFADVALPGETRAALRRRLLAAAQLMHIDLANNKKFYVCAAARIVTDLGFKFLKDGEAGEIAEHYCLDVGTDVTVESLVPLLNSFEPQSTSEVWQ